MKRCPACKRVESDDALVYCRADGTPLVSDPGSVSADAGTVRFGSSPVVGEVATSVLPQQATDAGMSRATGSTAGLDAHRTAGGTRELGMTKRRNAALLTVAAVITAAIVVSAYFYLSRKNNAAIQSIAVLPFTNTSANTDVEYLSDGITESLINSLSQLPNLSVKARSTVFHYKGKDMTPQQVGSELAVQAVLNGRLTQRGDQLTLSLELVDARTGNQIWGEQYNRRTADLVSLQSDIARDVSNKLRMKLSGADEQRVMKNYTANAEAYQLYLRGRFYWNKRTPADFQKSIDYFQQAIALDPNYALAYTGVADAYTLLPVYGGLSPAEPISKAREAALKALSIDDRLAEAHTALGEILNFYDYDFAGAEREYKRAIDLNPNYATAHQWYGELLTHLGRRDESIGELRRALEIDPFSLIVNRSYGEGLLFGGRVDEAIVQLKKTVALDPNFPGAHDPLSTAYQFKGNYAESVAEFAKARELYGQNDIAALARNSFAKGGYPVFLKAMTGEHRPPDLPSHFVAKFLSIAGKKDQAIAELNKSYEKREYYMCFLKVDQRFDPLRSDPRFIDLVRRVGLPQ
jgi:TolB-like protein